MASSKNNRSGGSSKKRYTTRQIMELTEKRRKQMDEEARQEALAREAAAKILSESAQSVHETAPSFSQKNANEQPFVQSVEEKAAAFTQEQNSETPIVQSAFAHQSAFEAPLISVTKVNEPKPDTEDFKSFHEAIAKFTRQVLDHPARFEFPPETNVQNKTEEAPEPIIEKEEPQTPPVVDGKAVAAMFREEPQNPSEQAVSDLIEREVDKALGSVVSGEAPTQYVLTDVFTAAQKQSDTDEGETAVLRRPAWRFSVHVPLLMEGVFIALSSVLLVLMFVHVVSSGWSRYYYDQSAFVVMMSLTTVWLNRRHIEKRTEWFWGSAVIIAGGLGVFLASALEGRAYIELAGFVTVCFGLFMWRYTEESATRLFFPLICLLFMLAPPELWEQALIPRLNDMIYSWSAGILNSFHLPALFDEGNFHVGAGTINALGDPTAFRSIVASMGLAAVCVSFQNMSGIWSMALFLSVVLWGILGNILRITITGVMLENFGVEYATMFFMEYSVVVVMVVLIAGLTLTAGFLPHKEE